MAQGAEVWRLDPAAGEQHDPGIDRRKQAGCARIDTYDELRRRDGIAGA